MLRASSCSVLVFGCLCPLSRQTVAVAGQQLHGYALCVLVSCVLVCLYICVGVYRLATAVGAGLDSSRLSSRLMLVPSAGAHSAYSRILGCRC